VNWRRAIRLRTCVRREQNFELCLIYLEYILFICYNSDINFHYIMFAGKERKNNKKYTLFLYNQLLYQNCILKLILQYFNDSKH